MKMIPHFKFMLLTALLTCLAYSGFTQSLAVTATYTPFCNDTSGSTVTVVAGNGTAPYIYTLTENGNPSNQWSQSTGIFTDIPVGYYTVTVEDANGLSGSYYAYVFSVVNAYLYSIAAICPDTMGVDTVQVWNGNGPYTYLWHDGSTSSSIQMPVGFHPVSVTVTDANGCVSIINTIDSITQQSNISANISTTVAGCTNGTATITSVNGGIAPYTYLWDNGATTATTAGLNGGSHSVVITDAQGCSSQQYFYIQQSPQINVQSSITPEHCQDEDGAITAVATNGTGPYSYMWSNGALTPLNDSLPSGVYYVTVTDANGCTGVGGWPVNVTSPVQLTNSITPTLCTAPTGAATITATGGTAPYSYLWNTTPVQTTNTISGLSAGGYSVTVMDAVGCSATGFANIANNTTLNVNISKIDAICSVSGGNVYCSPNGGVTPYSYMWSNGATTQNLTNVPGGYYSCTVTDNAGCSKSRSIYVYTQSPVFVNLVKNNASCIYTADGTATAYASGGAPPYTYNWSNGQTTQTATGLLPGYYSCIVTDANNCQNSEYIQLGYASTTSCAVTISGKVTRDENSDCIENGADYGLHNVLVSCMPSGGYKHTDYYGNYSFTLPPGNYTVQVYEPQYYNNVCPASGATSVSLPTQGTSSINNNFYIHPDSVVDVSITCHELTVPRPGFVQSKRLTIRNNGTYPAPSLDIIYKHDNQLTLTSATPLPLTYNPSGYTAKWNLPAYLQPLQGTNINITHAIPANLLLGTILESSDTVQPLANEVWIWNNWMDCYEIVQGSYDPNMLEVKPKGIGTPGFITTTDSVLTYTIHFQNTGNYPTSFVELQQDLDADLDLSTFKIISSSHENQIGDVRIEANGKLHIEFPNLSLTDSASDMENSMGYVAFSVEQKPGLMPGTEITGSASIYFDFNAPVITNSVLNTIFDPDGIKELANVNAKLYPNPTGGLTMVEVENERETKVKISIVDMLGREITSREEQFSGKKVIDFNLQSNPSGMYNVIIYLNGARAKSLKLVKTD